VEGVGFPSAPPVLPVPLISTVQYRPLGKSSLHRTPWPLMAEDYIPTQMSVKALQLGLEKCMESYPAFPEDLVCRAQAYVISHLRGVLLKSVEENVLTYEKACGLLTLSKSPGYPYYYRYSTKEATLLGMPDVVRAQVDALFGSSPDIECIFALTEKSELRQAEKVRAGKTRVFMASDMHHLIASKMLFSEQNESLLEGIGHHPCTIGIQLPGPQFTSFMTRYATWNDGDISGCDQRFSLRLARAIRDIRKAFLPARVHSVVDDLYDWVYAGVGVALGGMYRVFGNKSGWENTGVDNSLMSWLGLLIAFSALYPNKPLDSFWAWINGDDHVVHLPDDCSFKDMCEWLKNYGLVIECHDWSPRPSFDVVFLSHQLRMRFVHGFGDFACASGNLPKLLSSIGWVKTNQILSWEESCVAHLVGLRICLFPWQDHFDQIDALLGQYLGSIVVTPFIREVLKSRFSEVALARLHTRAEGSLFSLVHEEAGINQVVDQVIARGLIKCKHGKNKTEEEEASEGRKEAQSETSDSQANWSSDCSI